MGPSDHHQLNDPLSSPKAATVPRSSSPALLSELQWDLGGPFKQCRDDFNNSQLAFSTSDDARNQLDLARATRDVCLGERQLAELRLRQSLASLRLRQQQLETARRRVNAANLHVGKIRAAIRKSGLSLQVGLPSQVYASLAKKLPPPLSDYDGISLDTAAAFPSSFESTELDSEMEFLSYEPEEEVAEGTKGSH
ncbi:hypothetical protein JAAARDRAFT_47144 [Jaapia argillacea MUCL 33604]|uniref:Uncharacterized protein n=1 Tax=Jaapia argillacea MUCL 33604 TaxID=933084 RepID=A0A067Q5K3_9AGAM|nr:hypothetical protein JAAARDRAFT_47144 [Jaapia argillacea MUCL 33604]